MGLMSSEPQSDPRTPISNRCRPSRLPEPLEPRPTTRRWASRREVAARRERGEVHQGRRRCGRRSSSGFLVLIVLLVFITQNTESVDDDVHLFAWHWRLPLGVQILLSAVLGGLLTVLVGTARIVQLRRAAKKNLQGGPEVARRGQRMDTSSSMESFGRSPSTIAVTHAEFKVIDPLWLSRNAVSAASRPVLIRTSVCRGARQGRVDHPPVPVDVGLGDRVEVHRLTPRRVDRDQPRRHVHRTQQRNHQMCVVAAHARAGQQCVGRAVDRVGRTRNVVQPGTPPTTTPAPAAWPRSSVLAELVAAKPKNLSASA